MANQEHLDILRQGVKAWNQWREIFPKGQPDLTGADLVRADLYGADLSRANLSKANLLSSRLIEVNLRDANLSGANLSNADLSYANLSYADLRGATLLNADLFSATLIAVKLDGADFSHVTMMATVLGELDLSKVRGLENVTHYEPSIISIDTIYRSQGQIPDVFLQGAGVPETFITYAHSLVMQPVDYYSCFISYSSRDQDFAERLYADLQSKGVRIWFAPEDLKIGDKFWHRIDESIRLYDKLLVVLSEHSVQSDWVEREAMAALEKEKQGKIVLFPITLDDAVKDCTAPWAADLQRQRHIGNFQGWKNHNDYQKAFERLLRDLKASS
jgi:hypothetical protein